MGERYLETLEACEPSVARNVTGNLYERHLKPIFLDGAGQIAKQQQRHKAKARL